VGEKGVSSIVVIAIVAVIAVVTVASIGGYYLKTRGGGGGGTEGRGTPPSGMMSVTAKAGQNNTVTITINHEGGDALALADLSVQASDSTGTMQLATLSPSSGTLYAGSSCTATYNYGADPSGKYITVYVIHNPSKQKIYSGGATVQGGTGGQVILDVLSAKYYGSTHAFWIEVVNHGNSPSAAITKVYLAQSGLGGGYYNTPSPVTILPLSTSWITITLDFDADFWRSAVCQLMDSSGNVLYANNNFSFTGG
jgi:hypothetical protein